MSPRVSVLMPTYRHAHFIRRAIASLRAQALDDWELIIVDDGSPDDTRVVIEPDLADERIRYQRLARNEGMGVALNRALDLAWAPFIAYLPSDDVYYADHLATLAGCLDGHPEAVLAYSGIRHHYNRLAVGLIEADRGAHPEAPGHPGPEGTPPWAWQARLQLVQVLHRRTDDRWVERAELVTDDLDRMFWSKLRRHGDFIGTEQITCEWVDHPDQRHKVLQEPLGGINPYRARYDVRHPLRFHSTVGNRIDEVEHYRRFHERPDTPMAADGLTILLVGELAYNPERVLALEERGNRLYGLWTPNPYWFNTVGPVPFGHVEDLPRSGWREAVRELRPDIIYALLNWQTVPFVHHVLNQNPGIPFVWHFKEGPFICLQQGMWSQLCDLYMRSDGRIYSSPEMRDWFATALPGLAGPSLVLDGDLPKREWFAGTRSTRLSEIDGQLHTVVPGRPIGLHPETVGELARAGVHLHFYGDFTQGLWHTWIKKVADIAPDHLHLHGNVDQEGWVSEFSRYDAGWLHYFKSRNEGDVRRADWDDLNYPARMATLVAAGLPLLQADNGNVVVATQALARKLDIGLFFSEMAGLGEQLRDERRMAELRDNVWHQRETFTFDYHADRLLAFFREVIASRSGR